MTGRVRDRLRDLWGSLRDLARPPRRAATPVLKGSLCCAVRIRDPVPGLFREAVFWLREDLAGEKDAAALLRQARAAARGYTADYCPPRPPLWRRVLPCLLSAAAAALLMTLLGG